MRGAPFPLRASLLNMRLNGSPNHVSLSENLLE